MTHWTHPEPTLESVKGEMLMFGPSFHVERLIELFEQAVPQVDPETGELYAIATRRLKVTAELLERTAEKSAPQKLARDHQTWAELQAAEQEQAA